MSMRRHRASLFVEQSVFLPGRPKKQKTNLSQIKLMTFCLLHMKNGVLSDLHHINDVLHTSTPLQPRFK